MELFAYNVAAVMVRVLWIVVGMLVLWTGVATDQPEAVEAYYGVQLASKVVMEVQLLWTGPENKKADSL